MNAKNDFGVHYTFLLILMKNSADTSITDLCILAIYEYNLSFSS